MAPFKHQRRHYPIMPQAGQKRGGLPVAVRHTAVASRHIGLALLWHLYDHEGALYQAGNSAEHVLCPGLRILATILIAG